ncbi:hypothetical protein [Pollutibacter soli]
MNIRNNPRTIRALSMKALMPLRYDRYNRIKQIKVAMENITDSTALVVFI